MRVRKPYVAIEKVLVEIIRLQPHSGIEWTVIAGEITEEGREGRLLLHRHYPTFREAINAAVEFCEQRTDIVPYVTISLCELKPNFKESLDVHRTDRDA